MISEENKTQVVYFLFTKSQLPPKIHKYNLIMPGGTNVLYTKEGEKLWVSHAPFILNSHCILFSNAEIILHGLYFLYLNILIQFQFKVLLNVMSCMESKIEVLVFYFRTQE